MTQPERDPRIYFAAERTFLSWIRTGLALMGFGFVVARFGWFLHEIGAAAALPARPSGFSLWTGTALVIAGVVVNVAATMQHLHVVRSLNEGREVTGKPSASGIALALLLAAAGFAMAVYLLAFK